MQPPALTVDLRGTVRLIDLAMVLREVGVDLAVSGDLQMQISYSGSVTLSELVGVIEAQVGPVEVQGNRWVVDAAGGVSVRRASAYDSGPAVVSSSVSEVAAARAVSRRLASSRRLQVSVWLKSMSANVQLSGGPGGFLGTGDASASKRVLTIVGIDGGPVSSRDRETRQIPDGIEQAANTTITSTKFKTQEAGLIVNLRVAGVGASWHVVGTIELSRFLDGGDKVEQSYPVDYIFRKGEKVTVCELTKGDISATLAKRWGIGGGAGVSALQLSVDEISH